MFLNDSVLENLREKLKRNNVSIKVDFDSMHSCKVMERGELQLAILIEMIRREGYGIHWCRDTADRNP
jgi:predicted membrane GTPase involved in stress response